jgi:hypothetical protein
MFDFLKTQTFYAIALDINARPLKNGFFRHAGGSGIRRHDEFGIIQRSHRG